MHRVQTYSFKRVVSILFIISLAINIASAESYIGTNAIPQGKFFDANGQPITVTVSNSKITFSKNVIKISSYAFHNCTNLKEFELPSSVTEIGYFAFSNCNMLTKSVYNKTIFARLPIDAESCTVKDGTKEIASAAFRKCSKLSKVELPNSITTIGESAFAECSLLSSITIPKSTTKIGNYAFFNCSNLRAIYVESSQITNLGSNAFAGIDKTNCVLFVPNGKISNFSNWGFSHVVSMPSENIENLSIVSLEGSYSGSVLDIISDYLNSINVQVVDLTNATLVDGTISLTNQNVLFKTKKSATDLKLKNTKNIVVNGTCDNLVITDGYPFGTDAQFNAIQVNYSRNMTNSWGTICLPFKLYTNDNVQYYTAGSVHEDILTLEPTNSVDPGQPAIFKRKTGTNYSVEGTNTSITKDLNNNTNSTGDDICLFGTYTPLQLEEEGLYYISKDKFWLKTVGNHLTVNPFRAWFTIGAKKANTRSLSIEEYSNEASSLNAINAMIDGTAQYFDEFGNQQQDLKKGVNIIKTADGSTKKILLK